MDGTSKQTFSRTRWEYKSGNMALRVINIQTVFEATVTDKVKSLLESVQWEKAGHGGKFEKHRKHEHLRGGLSDWPCARED